MNFSNPASCCLMKLIPASSLNSSVFSSTLFPAMPTHLPEDPLDPGKSLLEEFAPGFVLELERLLVELAPGHADEHLGPRERERLEEHHDLAPLILHAPAAERAACDRLDRNRLVLERLVLHARHPVDR